GGVCHLFGLSADARTAIFKTWIGGAWFIKMRPAAKGARSHCGSRMVEPLAILGRHAFTVNAVHRSHSMICSSHVDWASAEQSGPGSTTVETRTVVATCFDCSREAPRTPIFRRSPASFLFRPRLTN